MPSGIMKAFEKSFSYKKHSGFRMEGGSRRTRGMGAMQGQEDDGYGDGGQKKPR